MKYSIKKGKDISTMYTRNEDKKNGRNGYVMAKSEKLDSICPSRYGMFLQSKGRNK